jgi:hypothetical protein
MAFFSVWATRLRVKVWFRELPSYTQCRVIESNLSAISGQNGTAHKSDSPEDQSISNPRCGANGESRPNPPKSGVKMRSIEEYEYTIFSSLARRN